MSSWLLSVGIWIDYKVLSEYQYKEGSVSAVGMENDVESVVSLEGTSSSAAGAAVAGATVAGAAATGAAVAKAVAATGAADSGAAVAKAARSAE